MVMFGGMRGHIRDPLWWMVGGIVSTLFIWMASNSIDDVWPFEVHVVPPRVETVMPVAPGDAVVVRWHTRIQRDCHAAYSRRLERDDGLTYQLGSHRGSYVTPSADENGKVFSTQFRVPSDAPGGLYRYIVTTDVRCWPWTRHTAESPAVMVEVR